MPARRGSSPTNWRSSWRSIDVEARRNDENLRRINPLKQIPVLVLDDGSALFDSPVICEYLNAVGGGKFFPGMNIWRHTSGRWKALGLQALGDGIADAAVACAMNWPSRKSAATLTAWRAARPRSPPGMDALERVKFAKDPTIGEIAVACALGYIDFRLPDLDWRARIPNLSAWYAQFCEYPSMKATAAAHEGLLAMKIDGKHYRSVWPIGEDAFGIIDQTKLPHEFETMTLRSADDAARVIKNMNTRGAPLIGVVGAYGLALAMRGRSLRRQHLSRCVEMLAETRPTAINLRWALWRMRGALLNQPREKRAALAWQEAAAIADEDVAMSEAIGQQRP